MHNKLFIADGVMAVAGGRNIADEYFLRSESANFIDMDAFVMGAVVRSMAQIFDRYWNSEVVYPIEAVGEPLGDKAARAKAFDAAMAARRRRPARPAADRPARLRPAREELDSGQLGSSGASPAPSPIRPRSCSR
jgi:putative cardiolipin synthase